jgi:UPF0716 protein FxsA
MTLRETSSRLSEFSRLRQGRGKDRTVGRWILGLFVLVPLLEIALLIKVGQTVGLLPTLLLLIGGGLLGGLLLRWQGMSVLRDLGTTMGQGTLPGRALADTMLIGVAALFLILPGLISDGIAILLLLPPVRHAIYRLLSANMVVVSTRSGAYQRRQADEHLIELDEDDYRPR